jgi:hypothetical protein
MKKLVLLALALGSLAAACAPPTTINITPSGGTDNDGGEGGESITVGNGGGGSSSTTGGQGGTMVVEDAHAYYVSTVHPALSQVCTSCHNQDNQVGAPAFLDFDAELSYQILKSYPNVIAQPVDSILMTKGVHSGPALSGDQSEVVAKWLTMELNEGGNVDPSTTATTTTGAGPDKPTLEELLEKFASVMDYDIWVATGMDTFPQQQTNGEGPCQSCHNAGAGALWLSADPLETFEKNKQFPYIMRLVTPIYEGSDPVDLAMSNRLINKGIEPCAQPPICHPKYTLTAENKAALEDFVSGTLEKFHALP